MSTSFGIKRETSNDKTFGIEHERCVLRISLVRNDEDLRPTSCGRIRSKFFGSHSWTVRQRIWHGMQQ